MASRRCGLVLALYCVGALAIAGFALTHAQAVVASAATDPPVSTKEASLPTETEAEASEVSAPEDQPSAEGAVETEAALETEPAEPEEEVSEGLPLEGQNEANSEQDDPDLHVEGLSSRWPPEILALGEIIVEAATNFGHDPDLFAALVKTESWFSPERCPQGRPDLWGEPGTKRYSECQTAWKLCPEGPSSSSCKSVAGAIGPAQVMPYHFSPWENGRDLETNIHRGAEILRDYTDRKGGNIRTGLAAYYCGPNKATYPAHCWSYVEKVMDYFESLQQ